MPGDGATVAAPRARADASEGTSATGSSSARSAARRASHPVERDTSRRGSISAERRLDRARIAGPEEEQAKRRPPQFRARPTARMRGPTRGCTKAGRASAARREEPRSAAAPASSRRRGARPCGSRAVYRDLCDLPALPPATTAAQGPAKTSPVAAPRCLTGTENDDQRCRSVPWSPLNS